MAKNNIFSLYLHRKFLLLAWSEATLTRLIVLCLKWVTRPNEHQITEKDEGCIYSMIMTNNCEDMGSLPDEQSNFLHATVQVEIYSVSKA